MERPALARLRTSIFDGPVKTLVVWKIDRLSRDQRHGINLLADWCERGVRIVSVTQQIDLNGAVGRMVASVLLGLAEIESEYRRERQSDGIRVAKARGLYRGRKKGTTKAKPSRAKELRRRGLTAPEVARALGVSERTAYRYLADDTGKYPPRSQSSRGGDAWERNGNEGRPQIAGPISPLYARFVTTKHDLSNPDILPSSVGQKSR